MSKQIITISRQCGSGGHTIGSKVAERLNIPFYDREILKLVAERSGLTEETIKEQGEYATHSRLHTLSLNISRGYNLSDRGTMVLPDQIFAYQTEIIKELAEKGSCVIVGRCADTILQDDPDCFNVFIHGNIDDRRDRVIREHGVPEKDAVTHVLDRDRKRSQHYKFYTDKVWGMAQNYHLCLDSSFWGIDGCVDLIVSQVRKHLGQQDQPSD